MAPFCSGPPPRSNSAQGDTLRKEGAAGAFVAKSKIWEYRQHLTVHFMNEDFIEEWRCGGGPMTTETIMAWAKVWNSPGHDSIPELVKEERKNTKADIRVKFSSELVLFCLPH